ncbi:hypothetical protein [Rhodococcus sp. H29-C3]|uniref:hypothetical protein n=1 Tax=Rhodococcus sp. H29-C3 TaxID=3046307 RepID=UPI0024B96431|nr:hypothetical protein [Rhodococcus sp. H29-C3]MDJ0360647.1 hypothetical protein [Rhodococcus sp. H29-C3]
MDREQHGLREDYFPAGTVAAQAYSPSARRFTSRHRELLEQYSELSSTWSEFALAACLRRLSTSSLSEAWGVGVADAWTDGPDAFCVVYRYMTVAKILEIRMTQSGPPPAAETADAERFGREVADFDIGEPLGTVAHNLRQDKNGIYWWGYLDAETPEKPT